ncbi:JAB domain-containing protein [Erythrobacter sp. HKB08]|uniref:JAB domain-containing protein n=1 Tax=Erythrobacter sp. HKB08 TaxID=2502843 RepID=UPI0013E8BD2B|nr:JAB domain-containing protein [Erythrobacter sp. HKB08]
MASVLAPFAGERAYELAERLRGEFGSLRRALNAPHDQLIEAAGPHAKVCELLHAARRLVDTADREELVSTRVDSSDLSFMQFIRDRIGYRTDERMLVFFTGPERSYLLDEEAGIGGQNTIRLSVAKLFRRALAIGAQGFLLAHNHPSGICRPSEEDRQSTRELAALASRLELEFHDHVIVTHDRAYSMQAGGHF